MPSFITEFQTEVIPSIFNLSSYTKQGHGPRVKLESLNNEIIKYLLPPILYVSDTGKVGCDYTDINVTDACLHPTDFSLRGSVTPVEFCLRLLRGNE